VAVPLLFETLRGEGGMAYEQARKGGIATGCEGEMEWSLVGAGEVILQ
jgi:hypothetical protein